MMREILSPHVLLRTNGVTIGVCRFRQAGVVVWQIDLLVLVIRLY